MCFRAPESSGPHSKPGEDEQAFPPQLRPTSCLQPPSQRLRTEPKGKATRNRLPSPAYTGFPAIAPSCPVLLQTCCWGYRYNSLSAIFKVAEKPFRDRPRDHGTREVALDWLARGFPARSLECTIRNHIAPLGLAPPQALVNGGFQNSSACPLLCVHMCVHVCAGVNVDLCMEFSLQPCGSFHRHYHHFSLRKGLLLARKSPACECEPPRP